MLKKMTSSDSTTTSAENNRGRTSVIQLVASIPLSVKLLLLVIIALIPRIIVFLQPQIITLDGTLYIKMAQLFSGGEYAGTPGSYFNIYPLMIFLVQKFATDWELSGQLISITLGTLTVIPVFLLGRSLYNEKIGWLSALFYITIPNFLKFDSQVIRDPTLWFFVTFTLWLVWEGTKKNQSILYAIASVTGGMAALTRVEGFILWGALALYVAFKKSAGISIKRKMLNLSLLILLFPILVAFILFPLRKDSSRKAFGEMTSFSLNVIKVYISFIPKPRDPIDAMDQKLYKSLPVISLNSLELTRRHRFVLAISEVIYKFVKSANFLIILILLGFWKRRKEGCLSSDRYLFYAFVVLFLMSVFYARHIYYFSTRHGLTLVLPTLFFAGYGLDFIVESVSEGVRRFVPKWASMKRYIPYVITIFLVSLFLVQGFSGGGREKARIKEIGMWLREKGFQGSVIMGPKRFLRVPFYANGTFSEMPDSWEKMIDSVRRNAVKIIVIDSSTIEQECPGFLSNWSKAGLVPLARFKGTTEIYSVP